MTVECVLLFMGIPSVRGVMVLSHEDSTLSSLLIVGSARVTVSGRAPRVGSPLAVSKGVLSCILSKGTAGHSGPILDLTPCFSVMTTP